MLVPHSVMRSDCSAMLVLSLFSLVMPVLNGSSFTLVLLGSFKATDKGFLQKASEGPITNQSGACVVAALVMGNFVYIANAGDCRAVLARCPIPCCLPGANHSLCDWSYSCFYLSDYISLTICS